MQQKLLRKAGLLGLVLCAGGMFLAGCVDEPTPPVVERMQSTVRFVHAVPDAGSVDLWMDGTKIASGIGYKGTVNYMDIPSGLRFFRLTPTGQDTSKAIFRQLVSMRALYKTTAVFFGLVNNNFVNFLQTQERLTYADETNKPALVDSADVKLMNMNMMESAITMQDGPSGATLIGPVEAYTLSTYTHVKGGAYTFYVMAGGVEVTHFDATVSTPKYRYTYILVGDSQNPEVLRLQDEPR